MGLRSSHQLVKVRGWIPRFVKFDSGAFIRGLVFFRMLVLSCSSLLPPSMPHVHRQLDTLGISMRFWSRWTKEPELRYALAPAVPNSGDLYGISISEFPVLSWITAPFFSLGLYWSRVGATLFLLWGLFFLTWMNVRLWRGIYFQGIPAEKAMSLLPIFSLGAMYFGKFMPDYLAMILMLLGCGMFWKNKSVALTTLFFALAILIKPTSIAVVLFLLMVPDGFRRVPKQLVGAALGTLKGLLYYLEAVPFLKSKIEDLAIFYIERRPVIQSLVDFFSAPESIGRLLHKHTFFLFGFELILGVYIYFGLNKRSLPNVRLWVIFAMQILAVAALDGAHAFVHDYYYLGLSVTAALLFVSVLEGPLHKYFRRFLLAAVLITVIEISWNDLNFFLPCAKQRMWRKETECRELIRKTPEFPWGQGQRFRSPTELYPELALCFNEMSGSKLAKYGFFPIDVPTDEACRVVQAGALLKLVECQVH